ncbi:Hsp20/alpha crystallin family protein [Clostridiaceae bacterium 35-E11]
MFRGLVPFVKNTRDMESFLDKMFHESFDLSPSVTDIKVDIKELDSEYLLEAEVPGVNKDQINIDYQNNYLTISVENVNEVNEERENYIRRERSVGRTSRSFYVENIQHEGIQAKYENGLLKVILPKDKNAPKRKSIDIQ